MTATASALRGKALWALDQLALNGPLMARPGGWVTLRKGTPIGIRTVGALVRRDLAAERLVPGGRFVVITPRGMAHRLSRRARLARKKGKVHAEAAE
ncbi:MAG: hypothetical protein AB1592_11340 [Pseudomonadota bacterium]